MEFLDPNEKRRRAIRLSIGYFLSAVLIALATVILFFRAYGFDVDRQTGDLFQNGLVFFDSAPDDADIILNGETHESKTNVRLSLPAGEYDVRLHKDGYRDWENNFSLEGGLVERFFYPVLIPEDLSSSQIKKYKGIPKTTLQSPDRRWALVSEPGSVSKYTRFDLNSLEADVPKSNTVTFPDAIFSGRGPHHLKLVEWSADNENILVQHTFNGGSEYLLLNHADPQNSVNLNNQIPEKFDRITMRDKDAEQYYLFNKSNGRLSIYELGDEQSTPFLTNILKYKTSGSRDLIYSQKTAKGKKQRVVFRLGDDTYILRQLNSNQKILLDLSEYDGKWYGVVSIGSEKKTYIFKEPQRNLSLVDKNMSIPTVVLGLEAATKQLSFSMNSQMIMASSGREFTVYDAENQELYRYTIKEKIDSGWQTRWMDGHRLLIRSNGKLAYFEFDNKNHQMLTSIVNGSLPMFDRDYERLYTLSSKSNQASLNQTNLRLPDDF